MKFNYAKLKSKIVEVCGTQSSLGKAMGISKNAFSKKLNNKTRFSVDDIITIINLLDIPKNEISDYFFTEEV